MVFLPGPAIIGKEGFLNSKVEIQKSIFLIAKAYKIPRRQSDHSIKLSKSEASSFLLPPVAEYRVSQRILSRPGDRESFVVGGVRDDDQQGVVKQRAEVDRQKAQLDEEDPAEDGEESRELGSCPRAEELDGVHSRVVREDPEEGQTLKNRPGQRVEEKHQRQDEKKALVARADAVVQIVAVVVEDRDASSAEKAVTRPRRGQVPALKADSGVFPVLSDHLSEPRVWATR